MDDRTLYDKTCRVNLVPEVTGRTAQSPTYNRHFHKHLLEETIQELSKVA